jgi:hypothetical protein
MFIWNVKTCHSFYSCNTFTAKLTATFIFYVFLKSFWFAKTIVNKQNINIYVFPVALRPNAGQDFLVLEVSWSHTQRLTTLGRTPLDEWSARRRDLFLTTNNSLEINIHVRGRIRTHNLSGERPHTHVLDSTVTETGIKDTHTRIYIYIYNFNYASKP